MQVASGFDATQVECWAMVLLGRTSRTFHLVLACPSQKAPQRLSHFLMDGGV